MEQPGVRVEERAELGRTLVACRAFAPFEVVLSEAPVLQWRESAQAGGASFLDAAAAAPADVAAALLEFARPALDDASPRVRQQADAAQRWLAARGDAVPAGWTADTVHALLLVADTNTHSFAGEEAEESGDEHGPRFALFALASKAAHSCAPNCTYSSRRDATAGALSYVASRAVAAGEAVTFSYLAEEVATPRARRRAQLQQTKHFHCRCARCAGRDDCRGLRCGACKGGTLLCADADDALPSSWACARCGGEPAAPWLEAQLRAEAKLTARHAELDSSLRSGEALRRGPGDLQAFSKLAAAALAPTHWLAAAAASLRVTWAASQRAALIASLGTGRPGAPPPVAPAPWGGGQLVSAASFSAAAGAAGLELLRCSECVTAGCVGGDACGGSHPPAAGALHVALWALQDLRTAGAAAAEQAAAARADVAPRYLPLLRAQFGDDDADVRSIAAWIAQKAA
jgi:hypothetical protein